MDRFETFVSVLENLGTKITPDTTLLDFGCGSGELVRRATELGIDAYGCDIEFEHAFIDHELLASLVTKERVRKIVTGERENRLHSPLPSDDYRLPFHDGTFDVVISDQVLEHVFNYPEVVSELHRVIKPGGVFLHMFPPKTSMVEVHVNIPLAGVYHPDWWLNLWARLGVRNEYQRDLSVAETVEWNRKFLAKSVNYVSRSQLERFFSGAFDTKFVEAEFFQVSKRARVFLHPRVYAALRCRVMYGARRN